MCHDILPDESSRKNLVDAATRLVKLEKETGLTYEGLVSKCHERATEAKGLEARIDALRAQEQKAQAAVKEANQALADRQKAVEAEKRRFEEERNQRHPSTWDRIQRWSYDFTTNEASWLSEWSPPENPRYTKQQVHEDARQIVHALLEGSPHTCIERKGGQYRVWLGRLRQTRPVPCRLPQRTAKGRRARLKWEVAKLMEAHAGFQRVADAESTGSLGYRHRGSP